MPWRGQGMLVLDQILLTRITRLIRAQWWRGIVARRDGCRVRACWLLWGWPMEVEFMLYRCDGTYSVYCSYLNCDRDWPMQLPLVLEPADPACLEQLRRYVLQHIRVRRRHG